MRPKTRFSILLLLLVWTASFVAAQEKNGDKNTTSPAAAPIVTGKRPIIIIPGLTGSELINRRTGETVWFKTSRSKVDDLRLPISPNLVQNRDDLIAGDIIRGFKVGRFLPEVEIYEKLITAMQARGYREANWETAGVDEAQDTFFIFPYDWRRDNVENARLLIRRIELFKSRIKKPTLKFNVMAHSMGGLIARYAAMYGNRDIPEGRLSPDWQGGRHFDRIFLLGTPNEGSTDALSTLLNGFSYVGGPVNLPFVRDLNRFDVFTIPSIYQLLPHEKSVRAYDENLEPLDIDIYAPETWEKYNWGIWRDEKYRRNFTASDQRYVRPYFETVLARAKRFQEALNANRRPVIPVRFYLIGAECKDTRSGFLLLYNDKKDRWSTIFKPESFTRSNGEKVSADQLKPLLITPGDSVVPKSSLMMTAVIAAGRPLALPVTSELFQCELHSKLVTNIEIQDRLFLLLNEAEVAASGN